MTCIVGGGGKMGSAIVAGLLAADPSRSIEIVVRKNSDRDGLQRRFPSVQIIDQIDSVDDVVLAVKPKDILAAAQVASSAGAKRVLSVATGVTLDELQLACGPDVRVFRAVPNIGAQFQKSATGYCTTADVSDEDLAWVEEILDALGVVVRVDESQLDAVVGVAGSGIAFVLLTIESLIAAGVKEGLSLEQAQELGIATLIGAAEVASTGEALPDIRNRVTTPNGTTAAGIAVLEERNIGELFAATVTAAAERSKATGR